MKVAKYASESLRCESDLEVSNEMWCANWLEAEGAAIVRDC